MPCPQQNDCSATKMATLTDRIVNSLKVICNCNFTTRYITNSRWVCDPARPTIVIFEADVIGTGDVNSGTIAVDIIQWADRTGTVDVGTGNALGLQGGEVSTMAPTTLPVTSTTSTTSSTQPPATPTSFVWIVGIIAGVIVALILIAVIVVILLWWKRSKDTKNAK